MQSTTVRSFRHSLLLLRGYVRRDAQFSGAFLPAWAERLTCGCRKLSTSQWCKQSETGQHSDDAKKAKQKSADGAETSLVVVDDMFDSIPRSQKNKKTFRNAIGLFIQRSVNRRGHVEFIYAALNRMKEFGVHRDLEMYKKLIDVFPKGKFIPENRWQQEFYHYPKQQQCCIDVLDQAEFNAVDPDKELYLLVKNTFGEWTHAMRKMKRMMYWCPKFKNANPYPLPHYTKLDTLPPIELAKLAVKRMCRDPATEISVWQTQEAISRSNFVDDDAPVSYTGEKTWIVSGQALMQQKLLARHKKDEPVFVDGPFKVWVGVHVITYFLLCAERDQRKEFTDFVSERNYTAQDWAKWQTKYNSEMPPGRKELREAPSMHEQEEATILALVATGTSSRESLIAWTTLLQRTNEELARIPIVFRMRTRRAELIVPDVGRGGDTASGELVEKKQTKQS